MLLKNITFYDFAVCDACINCGFLAFMFVVLLPFMAFII